MKKHNLEQYAKQIRRTLSRKIKYSKSLLFFILINGFCRIINAETLWIDKKGKFDGNSGSTKIWYANANVEDDVVMLSNENNKTGAETKFSNKDFNETVVIGSRAVGGGKSATSIGYRAIVGKNLSSVTKNDDHQGTAIGYRTFAHGKESVSVGNDSVAYGESSISIGSDNIGKGNDDIGKFPNYYAYKPLSYDIWKLFKQNSEKFNYTSEYAAINSGNKSTTREEYKKYLKINEKNKSATKTHNWAYGDSSIAIGSRNVAYGNSSLAIGSASIAKGEYSTALGTGTLAFGDSSVALGNEVYVYNNQGVGVGNNVQAISKGSMVYGINSYAGGDGSISIGTKAMSNVNVRGKHINLIDEKKVELLLENLYMGDSSDGRDEIYKKLGELDRNKENLYEVLSEFQDGTGERKATKNNKNGAVAIGYYVISSGENSIALGRQAYSKGKSSVSVGPYAYAESENSFSLGYGSKSLGENSFAIGSYTRVEGKNSITLGVEAKVLNNGNSIENSMALGNKAIANIDNSVALGYQSTTNYFYKDENNKSEATFTGEDAINLEGYKPEDSSYIVKNDVASGIISVGGWKSNNGSIGLRRIVGVAPGALDSDVATVGQLKALAYVKKEGLVVYYTVEGNKVVKLVKNESDNKYYRVNTKNGEPLTKFSDIPKERVYVGAKGVNEKTQEVNGEVTVDIGDKIIFGHLKSGEIKESSDHAITGSQLYDLGINVLGIGVKDNKFYLDNITSIKNNVGVEEKFSEKTTYKDINNRIISTINKGYIFGDGSRNEEMYLGSIIEIKPGDTIIGYKGDNLKTKINKSNNKSEILISLKDEPIFKKVFLAKYSDPTNDNELTTKKYVDDSIKKGAKKFNVKGDTGSGFEISNNLKIRGENGNISTKALNDEVIIKLSGSVKDLESIEFLEKDGKKLVIKSNKISGLNTPIDNNDAANKKYVDDNKVKVTKIKDSFVEVRGNGGINYEIGIDKLELNKYLDRKYAKLDASNLEEKNKVSWRKNLNVYSKPEIDSKFGGLVTNSENKAVSGKNIYTAIIGAKTKVQNNVTDKTGILEIESMAHDDGIQPNVYSIGINIDKLKKITGTSNIATEYLKVNGDNINNNQEEFGKNIGIGEINNLSKTKLVQADAVRKYLMGSGKDSVRISENAIAEGEGSISIGKDAEAKNEDAISIGKKSGAKNKFAIALGSESDVTGEKSIAVGRKNNVIGSSSIALGEGNKVSGSNSFVIGHDNVINGRDNIVIGSRVKVNDNLTDAIIIGSDSEGVSQAVSVGRSDKKRKIVYVANPDDKYDAANKDYVDNKAIKIKGNDLKDKAHNLKLDKEIAFDSSESKHNKINEKDIKISLNNDQDNIKLLFDLNKSNNIEEGDYRVVTSDAVNKKLSKVYDELQSGSNLIKEEIIDMGLRFNANLGGEQVSKLGTLLVIKGHEENKIKKEDEFDYGKNIMTKISKEKDGSNSILISLSKKLQNLNSAEFENEEGNVIVRIDSTKIIDKEGNEINSINEALNNLAKNANELDRFTVKYDKKIVGGKMEVDKENITLGDKTTPVLMRNLKSGNISSDSNEAINGSQLYNSNKNISEVLGSKMNEKGELTTPEFKNKGTNYFDAINKNTESIEKINNRNQETDKNISEMKNKIESNTEKIKNNEGKIEKLIEITNKNSADIKSNTEEIKINKQLIEKNTEDISGIKKTLGNFKDKGLFKIKVNNKETSVKTDDTIEFLAGENLSVENENGKIKYSITDKPEFKSVQLGKVVLEEHDGGLKVSNGSIKWNGDDLTSLYESKNLSNVATINDLQKVANGGISFSGDSGSVHKKLSDTLSIKGRVESGHQNIKTIVNEGIELALNDNIKVKNSISAGSTTIDSNKLEFGNTEFSINSDGTINGFNPNKDNGIATVGYVNKVKTGVNQGIASVTAMANIPQVNEDHGFSVGAGVGYYEGKSAIAIGISGQNMDENIVYKASVGFDGNKATLGAGFNYNINKRKPSNSKLKELEEKYNKLENYLNNLKIEEFKEKLYVIDQFENDSFNPTNSQLIKLKAIVKEINEKYSDRIIDIAGHTDTSHTDKYNLDLGLKRANKIVDKMIELGLKNPQNIRKVSSFGYNNKVNSNELSSNRRVEIYIK